MICKVSSNPVRSMILWTVWTQETNHPTPLLAGQSYLSDLQEISKISTLILAILLTILNWFYFENLKRKQKISLSSGLGILYTLSQFPLFLKVYSSLDFDMVLLLYLTVAKAYHTEINEYMFNFVFCFHISLIVKAVIEHFAVSFFQVWSVLLFQKFLDLWIFQQIVTTRVSCCAFVTIIQGHFLTF